LLEPFVQSAVAGASRSHRGARLPRAQPQADKISDRLEVRRESGAFGGEGGTLANEPEGTPGTNAEGGRVAKLDGLRGDEELITNPMDSLKEGARVQVAAATGK